MIAPNYSITLESYIIIVLKIKTGKFFTFLCNGSLINTFIIIPRHVIKHESQRKYRTISDA